MNTSVRASLFLLICLCLLSSGCVLHRAAPESPCGIQEPIAGAWIYDPAGVHNASSEAVYLYIFKETRRFDAVAMSPDPTKPLTYEDWITGSWTSTGETAYNLTGEVIRHDFNTDSHETIPYSANLRYIPGRDVLFETGASGGIFTRASCEPQIPPGMDVTIPFD
jgi:hypothetical protein